MLKSNVKIHHPDGFHGWGLEFNHVTDAHIASQTINEDDASDFIRLMRYEAAYHRPNGMSVWFHQCGHDRNTGYQYFELWQNDQDYLLDCAQRVANVLGVEVEL